MGLEWGDLQDVNNIITQFFIYFIPFKCTHSIDILSAVCFQHLSDRVRIINFTQKLYN